MIRSLTPLAWRGVLLFALAGAGLALHRPGADSVGSPERTNAFVALLALAGAVYLDAVRVMLRGTVPRGAVALALTIAAAMRLMLLPAAPFLSSDIYRYVWDGQVQAVGINPYRFIPADPALEALRDPAVYPLINRAEYAPTIYPPVAEAVFAAVGQVSHSVFGMKAAMAALESVGALCLLPVLARAGLPRARVLIYAWNPLVLWSFAGDGHVDAAAIGLLGLALLCRVRRRDGLAGAVLAGAALVKFLPVVVAPAFLRGGRFWPPALAGAAVVLTLYALYSSVGLRVFGFLPAYGAEEGLANGSGFWLLAGLAHLVDLPNAAATAYVVAAMSAFAVLGISVARGRLGRAEGDAGTLCRDTAILAGCATFAISPHYPWYFAWLALPSIVAPMPAVLWLSVAPVVLYLDPFHERFVWPALVYVPALALAGIAFRRHGAICRTHALAPREGTP